MSYSSLHLVNDCLLNITKNFLNLKYQEWDQLLLLIPGYLNIDTFVRGSTCYQTQAFVPIYHLDEAGDLGLELSFSLV